jgi:hypothetical protein
LGDGHLRILCGEGFNDAEAAGERGHEIGIADEGVNTDGGRGVARGGGSIDRFRGYGGRGGAGQGFLGKRGAGLCGKCGTGRRGSTSRGGGSAGVPKRSAASASGPIWG